MQFQFSFKHMKTSENLKDYAEKKIRDRVEKFTHKHIEAKVTFSVDKRLRHVKCQIAADEHFNFQAENENVDMYAAVDGMVDKIAVQLKRSKEKLKNHKAKVKIADVTPLIPEKDLYDEPVDASDIIKYERARRLKTG